MLNSKTRFKGLLILLPLIMILNNCSSTPEIHKEVGISENFKKFKHKNYLVFQFDLIDQVYKKKKWVIYKDTREKQMTELFETFLMKNRYKIIERGKINTLIKELGFSKKGITENQGLKIGKMLNADAMVFGTISRLTFRKKYKTIYIVVSIKSLSVETGELLWKGDIDGTISYKSSRTGGEAEVQDLSRKIFNSLMSDL